ncbi:MAG: Elongation factor P [Candidatus Uhrbacteria bacterium GW2011_GWD2_52_7]|uniref:Elongation factor P n=1 Tax=Candidatus Uhrbacteria bacterium GW2011_GWD2_52_7 TaxID=1618989 RepID=A0A0G1XEV7_9BACT|nr:MAG: Elongation factor P [Candidatus Uhrbacteria bacterium GW2011_GWD2_52_7]
MASPNDIRKGTVLNHEGDLWVITGFQRVSPGKGSSFVRTRMKSLSSGKVVENNFKSSENVTFEQVGFRKMQFIFGDDNTLTFMDGQTYEQVMLGRDLVGDDAQYLKEGLDVTVIMHGEKAISMELPLKIEYTIAETEPAVKGDTASGNVLKEAKMDNGLIVRVPIFCKEGDTIMVSTESGAYVERVSR